jgi:Phage major capsid protein E
MAATGQQVSQVEQRELVELIDLTLPATQLILDLFYPDTTQMTNSRFLELDIYKGPRPLAGWTAPNARAIARDRAGFVNATIQLPYIKEARVLTPDNLRKRLPAQNVYKPISKQEAINYITGLDMVHMRDAIRRRFEFSAIQQLTTGKTIIKSDPTIVNGLSVDTTVVDAELSINQAASHRKVLTGTVAWSDATSNGGLNIENSVQSDIKLASDDSGLGPNTMIVGYDAFTSMRRTQQVRTELNQTQPTRLANIGSLDLDISPKEASRRNRANGIAKNIGMFQGLDVWLYAATYQDSTGAAQQIFPANGCLIGSTGAAGSIDYGALETFQDVVADILSEDGFFPQSIYELNPESILNLMQICGCPIMREPDAFVYTQVQ